MSVYLTQFPQRNAIYECFPNPGGGFQAQTREPKCKANNNHAKGDLSPKVTPLLKFSPAESPVL